MSTTHQIEFNLAVHMRSRHPLNPCGTASTQTMLAENHHGVGAIYFWVSRCTFVEVRRRIVDHILVFRKKRYGIRKNLADFHCKVKSNNPNTPGIKFALAMVVGC
jgi:hypothetical protein